MPLTPQDVQSKEFATTRFKPGYDEEEVDAFLDEVEAELTRLLTENADLRNRINQMQVAAAASPVAPAAVAEPVPAAEPVAAAPAPSVVAEAPDQAALRTLQMAQRTADSAVAEAKAEADKMVTDARNRAAELEREAQARHTAVMGQLENQRVALEARVEAFRAFEREYRTGLKPSLEPQLGELGGRPPAEAVAPASVSLPTTPSAAPAAAPTPAGISQGVPGLATPTPNPYAPAGAANPYAPRPAEGNPVAAGGGFESGNEGPDPSSS